MNNKFKISIPLAIIITLIAVIYQRSTGPTYPKKFDIGADRKDTRLKMIGIQSNLTIEGIY